VASGLDLARSSHVGRGSRVRLEKIQAVALDHPKPKDDYTPSGRTAQLQAILCTLLLPKPVGVYCVDAAPGTPPWRFDVTLPVL
jgi:hypothetical protein